MSIAFRLLLILILIVPTAALSDGLLAQCLVAVLAAAALAVVAMSARAADVSFTVQATRYLGLAAAVPTIWMIIQIMPTPLSAMSHSIWINAKEALNQGSWGHISVDAGATMEALAFYLANVALIVVGIFVARDRRRAELLLFALTAISTLTTIALLVARSGLIESLFRSETNEMLSSLSSLGVILWLTIGVRFIERQEAKETKTQRPKQDMQRLLALTGAGLLICIAGLAAGGTLNTALVVVFGVLIFGSIQAIRRIDLAGWGTGTSVVTLIAAAAMVILWRYDNVRALSPFLRFATSASADSIAVAQRMLSDAGWKGIGTGAYALLVPVYQELGVSAARTPSTGATFAIELGWPIALFAIAATIGLVIILFRGALVRGRDSFYPAAAAACTVTVLGQAFCDTSLLHSSIAIVVDLVVALGLAQSKSQATGR